MNLSHIGYGVCGHVEEIMRILGEALKNGQPSGMLIQLFKMCRCVFRGSSCVHWNYGEYCVEKHFD